MIRNQPMSDYLPKEINQELFWKIIESYFEGQHLKRCIRHQLESYNDFVVNQIQKTIDMFNPVTIICFFTISIKRQI